jgi:hypothetical protein
MTKQTEPEGKRCNCCHSRKHTTDWHMAQVVKGVKRANADGTAKTGSLRVRRTFLRKKGLITNAK